MSKKAHFIKFAARDSRARETHSKLRHSQSILQYRKSASRIDFPIQRTSLKSNFDILPFNLAHRRLKLVNSSITVRHDTTVVHIDPSVSYLKPIIEASRSILSTEYEIGDTPPNVETWRTAMMFLIEYSKTYKYTMNTDLPAPDIVDGVNGSIDLLWSTSNGSIVGIRIPAGKSWAAVSARTDSQSFLKIPMDLKTLISSQLLNVFLR
jgi:hypothetical protein